VNWLANKFPSTTVIGTDLSPPAQNSSTPKNCKFLLSDAEDPWCFEHQFTYIHARAVLSCFTSPLSIIKSAHSFLVPEGYLEFQDPIMPMKYSDPQPSPSSAFVRWNQLNMEASIAGARPWNNVQHYAKWMKEVGFVDVTEKRFFLPTWGWSEGEKEKRLGEMQLKNWLNAMEGMTARNLARIGWGAEESKSLVEEAKAELLSGAVRPFNDILVVWGRKAGGEEVRNPSA
jgi:hypothetical protein